MTMKYEAGSSVGECPTCQNGQIIFDGVSIASCDSCGAQFEVSFDDEEQHNEPSQPPLRKEPDSIGNKKLDLKGIRGEVDFNVPGYIRNSRAWLWAQRYQRSGNPYRQDSRRHTIFELYSDPCTFEQATQRAVDAGLAEKLSYITVLYEITHTCIVAGLLVFDPNTRVISHCTGKPVAIKFE